MFYHFHSDYLLKSYSKEFNQWPSNVLSMVTCIQYTFLIRNLSLRRLKAYDRNFNFKPDPIILPQSVPTEWPRAGYQQLLETTHKAVLPKISVEQIEAYFIHRLAGNTVIYYHRQIKKRNPNQMNDIQLHLHIYLYLVLLLW